MKLSVIVVIPRNPPEWMLSFRLWFSAYRTPEAAEFYFFFFLIYLKLSTTNRDVTIMTFSKGKRHYRFNIGTGSNAPRIL